MKIKKQFGPAQYLGTQLDAMGRATDGGWRGTDSGGLVVE